MGEMKFKRGEIKEAENDLEHCEKLLMKILNKAADKRKEI